MARWILVGLTVVGGSARAFCGFYVASGDAALFNEATQVVLMRQGTRTVLSMQNDYRGPTQDFAMVVPVPVVLAKENVHTLRRELFTKLDRLSAPRLVEYWEQDPCPKGGLGLDIGGLVSVGYGAGESVVRLGGAAAVRVEARFEVGEYDVVILSAEDALGLEAWLTSHGYRIPEGAAPSFRPYVQRGWKFFVARVNVAKVRFQGGRAALSPLRFHYDAEGFELPIRLGLVNAKATQDLIVHVLARGQRYEVANAPNVTIPTNLDLAPSVKAEFGPFYAALFDRTQLATRGAVVTEYAWDASTCDPCPSPSLSEVELLELGLDVLDGPAEYVEPELEVRNAERLTAAQRARLEPLLQNVKRQLRSAADRRGRAAGFVLTRLHARYTKDSLGDDLVFRAAPPIAGGREFFTSGEGLERGAVSASANAFQARYAVRHPWTGKVACKHPEWGVWGDRPGRAGDGDAEDSGRARGSAAGTALSRRDVVLERAVESPVPELALPGRKPGAGLSARAKAPLAP